jgi:enediyne biosynthesis protein E4
MTPDSNNSAGDTQFDSETEERDDAIIGAALRWSLVAGIVLSCVVGGGLYYASRPEPPAPIVRTELAPVSVRKESPMEIPEIPFTDVTDDAGIRFVHENGAYGQKFLPETMGGGNAFFDFDSDGDQDLLLVNSRRWSWDSRGAAEPPATMALYRNKGNGTGQFEDVTAGSGLDVSLYGMGAAVGDYDNDGRVDVFLSAVGSNRLFHNEGDGKFIDVTASAGIAGDPAEWSTSCGWFDFDNDGDLDLFVCNYVKWSREFDEGQNFQLTGGGRAYGRPQNFEGTFPYLYRNDGGGSFVEIAEQAGLQIRNQATDVPIAKSLGVTFTDFDHDGWQDIIVANDTVQNLLFHNTGRNTFEEAGAAAGIAYDMNGAARGAMGIDVACFRNNDSVGIAIGNFSNEMTALYVSSGKQLQFVDEAVSTGLGPHSRSDLTFGVVYLDGDLDGRLDLFCSNGHLEEEINRVQSSQHYEQPQQLFWNCGAEQFTEFVPLAAAKCGEDLLRPMVGRGASFADIDNDGDQDLLVTTVGRRPRLLRNDQQLGHHWLRLKLIGTTSNRDAIGARVEVKDGEHTYVRQVMPTRSYLSQSELPLTFGLGASAKVDRVTIDWPDGTRQELGPLTADHPHVIEQPHPIGPVQ